MPSSRKLTLKREVLVELTNGELAHVAGGALTTNTCFGICPPSSYWPTCSGPCTPPSNPLYSCPTLDGACFELRPE